MKYYVTKTEKRIVIFALIFYTILGLALCFRGMKLVAEYRQLEQEKQAFEDIIQIQKERIQEIEWIINNQLEGI